MATLLYGDLPGSLGLDHSFTGLTLRLDSRAAYETSSALVGLHLAGSLDLPSRRRGMSLRDYNMHIGVFFGSTFGVPLKQLN